MGFPFDPERGLINIQTELTGPSGDAVLRFALDTGATNTVVNVGLLVAIGCDPATVPERVQLTTGSGVEFAPRVRLEKVVALGKTRIGFSVLAHTLPPGASVDGLLGLDFLRGHSLAIDFRSGQITLV